MGAAEKLRSDSTHVITPYTYTSSAQAYVNKIRKTLLAFAALLLAAPASTASPEFKPLVSGGSYASTTYKNVRYGIYQAVPAQVSLHWKPPTAALTPTSPPSSAASNKAARASPSS